MGERFFNERRKPTSQSQIEYFQMILKQSTDVQLD